MELYAEAQESLLSYYNEKNVALFCVCGVFSSSFYLEGPENSLFLLHDREYGLLPFGFAAADTHAVMERLPVQVGMRAVRESSLIYIPDAELTLHLQKAELQPRKKAGVPALDMAGLERVVRMLESSQKGAVSELVTHPERPPLDLFARMAAPSVLLLRDGMRRNSGETVAQALSRLLGLGPGLTPSMDDFLTGVLSTFYYARTYWSREASEYDTLAAAVYDMSPRFTGKISCAYLQAAAAGGRFSLLEDVLDSFSPNDLRRLLAVGGHSGGDMLTGMLWAVEYILKR